MAGSGAGGAAKRQSTSQADPFPENVLPVAEDVGGDSGLLRFVGMAQGPQLGGRTCRWNDDQRVSIRTDTQ